MDFGMQPQADYSNNLYFGADFNYWFLFFLYLALVVLILLLIRRLVQYLYRNSSYHDNTIFQIRLPKEKPKDQEKEFDIEMIRAEIDKSESLIASIGGLRVQRGIKSWILGRNDFYSFEVVAIDKRISYYLVCPTKMMRYIEQQIHAYFPEAAVDIIKDYNIFKAKGAILAGYLKTKRTFIFPIKTYKKLDTDSANSIINVLSKLEKDDGLAIQYTVRSAKASWHRKAMKIVREVTKGKSVSDALNLNRLSKGISKMGDLAKSVKPPMPNEKDIDKPEKLSALEEEMLKGIEEKNSKAGLDVNLRVVVNAGNMGSAQLYLNNILSAFTQFNNYEYGNSFRAKVVRLNQKGLIHDFIYRRFNSRIKFLLNTEELASLFHLPLKNTETPNILWLTAKHAPAPTNIPDEGIILGENMFRGVKKEIKIKREDRRRHMYVIGKSGVGKSVLLASMAVQDIINGEGVCVVDPHGDLIDDILKRIPPERINDVILFSPSDMARPLALNLLEYDERYPEQKTFVINEMIKIFDKLYDLKATGGPIFEQYIRNAMLLIMSDPESGSTLMEIPKVLADAEFRRMKLSKCSDPTVVDFWKKEAEKAGGDAALANVVPYVTSKLTQFVSNDTMRPIIGQQKSSFNLRDVMDQQKILLLNLSKGAIGEMNAYLLGMILVGKILISALSRTDMPKEKRKDFYLYIDEFQNFTTDSICSILSEARKYNLNLIIAHQYLGQLVKDKDTAIKDAVFGNVGTWTLFKIGSDDAEAMEKEFSPVFNQYDLINIDKYTAYTKLLIDNTASRPFSMSTLWPIPGVEREDLVPKIKSLSRLKYGQDRNIIEAEIMRRTKIGS
jgi:hypothetical protein